MDQVRPNDDRIGLAEIAGCQCLRTVDTLIPGIPVAVASVDVERIDISEFVEVNLERKNEFDRSLL